MKIIKYLPHLQGIYYFITGLWPLVHMKSFLLVTGPKVDLWLVEVVGFLIVVIGAAIFFAAIRNNVTPAIIFIATGTAAGLGLIEFYYAYIDRIWNIYMADTVAEGFLILGWIVYVINDQKQKLYHKG